MSRLALLGRDGVILEAREGGIRSLEDMQIIPGSLEAIARLNHAGYRVAIVSNQPMLQEGGLDIDTLNRIHARLNELLTRAGGHLDALLICPHGPDAHCGCHKPDTGLFEEIAHRLELSLEDVPLFGDDTADMKAAERLRARPFLMATGNGEQTHRDYPHLPLYDDLTHAVSSLLDSR